MKGIQGLVVAIVLGVVGAAVNMVYLVKGREIDSVDFVGIKDGSVIPRGKTILNSHLERVPISKEHVGNLTKYAFTWKNKGTIVGRKAVRTYNGKGAQLVMRNDMRTPPPALNLKPGEVAIWVNINASGSVPTHILPGRTPVSFYLPKSRNGPNVGEGAPSADDAWELVGPFEVLTVGNRLGSPAVMTAEKISQKQPNVLTLRAKLVKGQLEPIFVDLKNYLRRTGNAPLEVVLHAPIDPEEDEVEES